MLHLVVKTLAAARFFQFTNAAAATNILKTTWHGRQAIDWIDPESQGQIASPPPLPPRRRDEPNIQQVTPIIPQGGPPGAVPVLRNTHQFPPKRAPILADHNVTHSGLQTRADVSGSHWYASSNEIVNNHGGGAQVNIYKAYLQSDTDFNLLQIAVVRNNVPNKGTVQSVEAGWIHYPSLSPGDPFLFTYFTTVGYRATGDNVGGYNSIQAGWVQVDTAYYPGIHLSPMSSIGGTQYEFSMYYQLYQGNWWLYFLDRFIGYYPASLFSANTSASSSLADHSNNVLFYGETFNSEAAITTSDMGSGNFPEGKLGQAAYMRNIYYFDTTGATQHYDSQGSFIISDSGRYRLQSHWNSGTSWGSYMYLGGPGAGGVVGG